MPEDVPEEPTEVGVELELKFDNRMTSRTWELLGLVYAKSVLVSTTVKKMIETVRKSVGTIYTRGFKIGSFRGAPNKFYSNRSKMLSDIDLVAVSVDAQTKPANTKARTAKAYIVAENCLVLQMFETPHCHSLLKTVVRLENRYPKEKQHMRKRKKMRGIVIFRM